MYKSSGAGSDEGKSVASRELLILGELQELSEDRGEQSLLS